MSHSKRLQLVSALRALLTVWICAGVSVPIRQCDAEAIHFQGLGFSRLHAVSSDGRVVVGEHNGKAVRWEGGSWIQLEDVLQGVRGAVAYDTSADGSTVVGDGAEALAFRWESGVMHSIGHFPGGHSTYASGVSADGGFVVGSSLSNLRWEAYRWHDGGMTALDIPSWAVAMHALDVSEN